MDTTEPLLGCGLTSVIMFCFGMSEPDVCVGGGRLWADDVSMGCL